MSYYTAIVTCVCGTPHELKFSGSVRCHCGRVVLLEASSEPNAILSLVDENGVREDPAFERPELLRLVRNEEKR